MPVRKAGAAFVPEDRRVGARHEIHVRHLLRVPPPVGPGAALVIGDGAEIHGGGVDHVADEVVERAVVGAAFVPAQLGVPVEVAAQHARGLAADHSSVAADGAHIARFVRMPGRGFERFVSRRFQRRLRRRRCRQLHHIDLLAHRAMVMRRSAVVGGPSHPDAAIGSRRGAHARAGAALAVRQLSRRRPLGAVQMRHRKFPIPGPGREDVSLRTHLPHHCGHPHRAASIGEYPGLIRVHSLERRGQRRLGVAPLARDQTADMRRTLATEARSDALLLNDHAGVLAPVARTRFPGHPDAIRGVDSDTRPRLESRCHRHGQFRALHFAGNYSPKKYVVVSVAVGIVGDPGGAGAVHRHRRRPVICRAVGYPDGGRPALLAKSAQKDVAVLAAESLPDQSGPALAIRPHARIDIGQWIARQPLERAPLLARRIEAPRADVPIAGGLLRPDHPDAARAIDGDLRQPVVAAGGGDPVDIAPLSVAIGADGDVVAIPGEAEPGDPDGTVGRGRHGGEVVLPVFVSDHRGCAAVCALSRGMHGAVLAWDAPAQYQAQHCNRK